MEATNTAAAQAVQTTLQATDTKAQILTALQSAMAAVDFTADPVFSGGAPVVSSVQAVSAGTVVDHVTTTGAAGGGGAGAGGTTTSAPTSAGNVKSAMLAVVLVVGGLMVAM